MAGVQFLSIKQVNDKSYALRLVLKTAASSDINILDTSLGEVVHSNDLRPQQSEESTAKDELTEKRKNTGDSIKAEALMVTRGNSLNSAACNLHAK